MKSNKRNDELLNNLKQLPHFQLTDTKRDHILQSINEKRKPIRKSKRSRPFAIWVTSCTIVLLFVFSTVFMGNYVKQIKPKESPKKELISSKGVYFDLLDHDGRLVYPQGV